MSVADAGVPGGRDDGIGRNTLFALLVQVTTAIFTAALTLYLVRALGPEGFGVFALALGISQVVRVIGELGIAHSLQRFLAEQSADAAAAADFLRAGLRLTLLTSVGTGALLFATADWIASALDDDLVWPLRGLALALIGENVMALYTSAFIALARIGVNLRVILLESSMELVASVALVAAGAGAAGASFGRAVGYAFGALVAFAIVLRLFGVGAVRRPRQGVARGREVVGYAAPLALINGLYALFGQLDRLIVGAMLSSTAVGVLAAPMRLAVPLGLVGQAVANGVAPRQASTIEAGPNVRAFGVALRWLIICQATLLAPVVVWAEPIVELLLGSEFAESASVLRLLAPFIFVLGVTPLLSLTVNYLGEARRRIPIVLAVLATNVAIDVALIPSTGVDGAAVGASVAYCLYAAAHLRLCRQALDFPLRPVGLTLLRALVAAGVMAAVLWSVGGTDSMSVGAAMGGAAAGAAAFVGVLCLTREIAPGEVGRARRHVTAQLARLTARA